MTFPILYKRTSTGKIQQWQQELVDNKYRTTSGQQNGKLVTSAWTVCEGKNIGKANETSPAEQARLEVESNYTKKLDQSKYHFSIDDVDISKKFETMLAKDFHKYEPTDKMYAAGDVFSQPKLDGMRCVAKADGLWSRAGKPIISVPHVFEALAPLFEADPDLVLDGELYADKLANDFNKIMSLCKQKKPTQTDFNRSKAVIQYHVYDIPSVAGGFEERTNELYKRLFMLAEPMIVFLDTTLVSDVEQLDDLNNRYLTAGMEGQIVRIAGTSYEGKRTKNLLKRKAFKDQEYKIIEIQEGCGNRSGMAGSVLYELGDGRTFSSNLTGGVEYYKQLLLEANEYVGGEGTVKYFQLTPDGIPRFPVTIYLNKGKRDY